MKKEFPRSGFPRNLQYLLLGVFLLILVLLFYEQNITSHWKACSFIRYKHNSNIFKRILVYTPFFGEIPWNFAQPVPKYVQSCRCKVKGYCELTYDKSKLGESDLVLFHARDMPDLIPIQRIRPKGQLWMHAIWENAYYTPSVRSLDKYFNLSLSYRLNSDLTWSYNWNKKHRKLGKTLNITLPNYAKGKTKLMAWTVSNCVKNRAELARKLSHNGVVIDTYGKCKYDFTNHNPLTGAHPYHLYKFYYAAENSLCEDYITEKYWGSLKGNNSMVPVVFGGSDYSNSRLAIPGSYIDAMSFSSPRKLAEYLLLLDKNDTLYNEYFAWKRHWVFEGVISQHPDCNPYVCELCERLHANNWTFRAKPLTSIINKDAECTNREKLFNDWIKKG